MKTKTNFLIVFGTVLIAALLLSGTVFAEGEVPPEAPVELEVLRPDDSPPPEPVEEVVITDVAPPPDEILADEAPVEDPPTVENQPGEAPAAESPVEELPIEELPAEVLPVDEAQVEEIPAEIPVGDDLPESVLVEELGEMTPETDVVLVDAEGLPVDMANQESAEALSSSDPRWKVGTVWYSVVANAADCYTGTSILTGTCKIDADPIQYAINWIAGDATKKPTNGLIYVESALYTNSVTINGTNANLSTLKGLIGLADGAGVYPTIQNNITISNLLTGFALYGFNIVDGVVTFNNNTGTLSLADLNISNGAGGDGLVVTGHKGSVVMTRVKSNDNDGNGATINNTAAPGNITITNSAFDRNGDSNAGNGYEYGLTIVTNGVLSINGVSFSNNDGQGLTANGFSSLTLQNSMLNGNQHGMGADLFTTKTGLSNLGSVYALGNWDSGISLVTNGSVSAANIQALWNGNMGMEIDTTGGLGTVTVRVGKFDHNTAGDGLNILSKRAVSIASIQSFQNGGYGVYIDNYIGGLGSGNVAVGIDSTASNLNANSFWGNLGGDGLSIISKGIVTISDFNAYNNALYGLFVRNDYGTGDITLQKSLVGWTNTVSSNTWDGIYLLTKGNVVIKNMSVDNNGGTGLYTGTTTKSISLTSAYFFNNMWEGVYAQAIGAVSLLDVTANGNGWGGTYSGIWIDNTFGTGAVTIQSPVVSSYRDFTNNSGSGIEIDSKGVVTVISIRSNNNGEFGLFVDNHTSVSSPAVSVLYGEYHENGFDGLNIQSKGNVLLTNISASNNDTDWLDLNYYSGAYIDNTFGSGSVTVNSTSSTVRYEFSNNTAYGLEITSKGVVSVGNVNAENNWDGGMLVDNSSSSLTAPKLVTVARSFFNNNGGDGLNISTIGSVSLAAIWASNNTNGGSGLVIDAYSLACLIPANVILASTSNEFIANDADGVAIQTEGYVTLSNITADWNGDNGIAILNRYAGFTGAVTIGANSGVWNSTNHNNWSGGTAGLEIETYGAVSITRLMSNNNNGMGGYILNTTLPGVAVKNVGIISGDFNSNEGPYGLYIQSLGAVGISYSHVDSNEQNGLYIITNGAVTLNNVTTMNNSLHESYILYTNPSAAIYEHLTSDVEGDKFYFEGDNAIPYSITLESSRFDAYLKLYDSFGTLIAADDNNLGGTDALITLLAGDLNLFQDYYLLVTTASGWGEPGDYKLTFNGSAATISKGSFTGAEIDNSGGTANVSITNWSNFSGNNEDGLVITTNKEVRLTNSHAGDNGGSGVIIPNGTNVIVENTSTSLISWFGNNEDYGVVVAGVTGAITVNGKMEFSNNGDDGLVLINNGLGNTYGVIINGAIANGNGGYGIYTLTNGHLLLSNLTANDNTLAGVSVDNSTGTGNMTLQGYNYFYYNGGNGFEAATKGIVSIMRVTAEGNGGTGIAVDASGTGKAVTLKSIISQFNGGDGINVSAYGNLTLYGVRSWLNGQDGFVTHSHTYSTIYDTCVAIGNNGDGIDATTPALKLSLPNTWYFGNDADNAGGDLDLRRTIV